MYEEYSTKYTSLIKTPKPSPKARKHTNFQASVQTPTEVTTKKHCKTRVSESARQNLLPGLEHVSTWGQRAVSNKTTETCAE